MEAITLEEMDAVSGGAGDRSWIYSIGRTIGNILGAGIATQYTVDAQDNFMLSALQYGA
ncbi:hypothetical protein ACLB1G_27875 [Oxalobacteraceae bacterium A2-2]